MTKLIQLNLITVVILFLTSCATSMSPIEVNNTLPSLTKSKFMSQSEAEEFIETSQCKYLTKGRKYVVPIGYTIKGDLKTEVEV
ncbi:hypothetical protein ACWGOQ_0010715 [Aquimarina sp. M1]